MKIIALLLLGTGVAGAQTLHMVSGNGQLQISQTKTNAPLVVQAIAANGQPAAGVNVTWAVTGPQGSTQDSSTTTDSNGLTQTFFVGFAPSGLNSYYPSTVTATAGSSTVTFVQTTLPSSTSADFTVVKPNVGSTLTGATGSTLGGAIAIQVFATIGLQEGLGIPNVGLSVQSYPDPTVPSPAACNAPGGTVLTDANGAASCDLIVTSAPGNFQLVGSMGAFVLNPTFFLQITPGAACTYSLSSSNQSFGAAAATGSVNVITQAGCSWTAVSNANFVSVTSGASGTGNGTVSYSVLANVGAARNGTLTIAGKVYTVNQSAAGGSGGLAVTTTALPTGAVGTSYSGTLAATGGTPPYTWSITGSLPSGLTLNSSTGVISGTPGSTGSYGITATVTDSAGNTASSSNLAITINGTSNGSFVITNVSFANGMAGQSYSQPLTSANFCIGIFSQNVNWSISSGALPPGLGITNNPDGSHSIAGTPLTSGGYPFTLTATDACGHVATMSFTIVIGNASGTQQMTVSAPTLSFMVQLGGAAPADQTFSIGLNTGSLNYSVTVTSSGGNWLVAKSPSTGTAPASFTVGVTNYSSLTPGPYKGSVIINSFATNSPMVIPVTLTVTAGPALVLQTASSFTLSQVASSSQNLTPVTQEQIVLGSGASPVQFTASASTTDGSKWLIVLPASGTTPATLTASIDTGGLTLGKYTGTVTITPTSGAPIAITFTVTVTQNFPAPVSVVNAASFLAGAVSPGEIVTIYGTDLGPIVPATLQLDQFGKITTTLAGTQVSIGGYPAPIIYSATGQVSVIVPYEIAGNTTTSVAVQYLTLHTTAMTVPVATSAPGIFTLNGATQGAIVNQDGSINAATNGAAVGSIVSIYATGEGQTNPPGVDGFVTQGPVAMPLLPVTVQIGGQNAQVLYAGAAPDAPAGLLQVNAMIPAGVQHNASVPVVITVGTVTSQTGVTVAIAP